MINFLLKSIFQYSNIPLFHVQGGNSDLEKIPLFSMSCRNTETVNQFPDVDHGIWFFKVRYYP